MAENNQGKGQGRFGYQPVKKGYTAVRPLTSSTPPTSGSGASSAQPGSEGGSAGGDSSGGSSDDK